MSERGGYLFLFFSCCYPIASCLLCVAHNVMFKAHSYSQPFFFLPSLVRTNIEMRYVQQGSSLVPAETSQDLLLCKPGSQTNPGPFLIWFLFFFPFFLSSFLPFSFSFRFPLRSFLITPAVFLVTLEKPVIHPPSSILSSILHPSHYHHGLHRTRSWSFGSSGYHPLCLSIRS